MRQNVETITKRNTARLIERKSAHSINGRIGAELSWSRTDDRSACTRPTREKFLQRLERGFDPDGKLPPTSATAAPSMPSASTCSA